VRERHGSDDRVDGWETVGNSLGRVPLGGSDTEATIGWTDWKRWEIAWGEFRWQGGGSQTEAWTPFTDEKPWESCVGRGRDGSVDMVDGHRGK